MYRKLWKWLSVVLIVALLMPLFAETRPVSASPPSPPHEQPVAIKPEEMQEAVKILEPYVVRSKDGTFELAVEDPTALGVRPEVYQNLLSSVAVTNDLVRQGALTTDEDLNVYIAGEENKGSATLCEQPENAPSGNTPASCPGSNYVRVHWWGVEVGLDHCATNNLIYLLAAGATVSTIAALLSAVLPIEGPLGEILFGLAAAMIGFSAATYDWADNMYGCGSVTNYTYVGPNWVSPQQC